MNIKCDLAEYLVKIDSNSAEYLNDKGDLLVKLKKAPSSSEESSLVVGAKLA
jgi:hypothetical protein